MFIRDYSINTMADCSDAFWEAGVAMYGNDWDALTVWSLGA